MIDGIDDAMFQWGIQRRRIDAGGKTVGRGESEGWHVDGWPSRSIAGKTRDERDGASHIGQTQHFAEVLTGEALIVARAMQGMPERLRKVAYAHYVVPKRQTPTKEKVRLLGYKHRTAYYDDLHSVHLWVQARWQVPRDTDCSDSVATL